MSERRCEAHQMASDEVALLVLVALLGDPWRWWTTAKLTSALASTRRTVDYRLDVLRHCGIVERLPFKPVCYGRRDRVFWVSPNGVRAARAMIRAHFQTLNPAAARRGLSVRKALGFGELLDSCQCRCGHCCCGLPAPVAVPGEPQTA